VFVYDTSKDSDGGAWRTGALAQASSWYNETLNTATRGSRREFPAVAVIVAEATKVTIYDGDDPSLPMWMVFTGAYNNMLGLGSTYIFVSVAALNGKITPCSYDGAMGGLKIIDFAADKGNRVGASASSPTTGRYNGTISQRNAALGVSYVTGDYSNTIVSNFTNDVAMTVLPDAPIDPATGLPVPTIACLVAETEVTMADGSTKRLDQVVVGDVVKTLEGEHSVLNWWDQGIKDVIELEFDGGQKITCTSDHKIRTTEGWVEAGDLTDAHKVVGL
jgi:major membrane immunogen (membrane-anchored lipoprotein)